MNEKTKEFRQQIAEMFIKSLEEKQLDWKKEWNGPSMYPVNAINNKRYRGINKFWLGITAMTSGTEDPRWCTFKQIQDKGWKLNKGSKGLKVEYWLPYDKSEKKGISWDNYRKRCNEPSVILVTRYYVVFNGKDIDGIPPLPMLAENNINPDEIIAKLSQNMGVEILNDGGDGAFYLPSEDKIHMPKVEYFKTDYAYNATALHEIAHSTGAAHRLNRNVMNMFGSSDYAYEELIAEITSCFMSVNLKVVQDENHINNHKAYVQSWINAIKEKPETLIKAIREAEKTANYMEYNAELINEKDYKSTLNESLEVNAKDIQEDYKEHESSTMERPTLAEDITNVKGVDRQYNAGMRETTYTFECDVRGVHDILTYEVSQHDDVEGFTIHTYNNDVWDNMSEPELRKLEVTISQEATFYGWQQQVDNAKTAEDLQDVRYGIMETENLNLSQEQIERIYREIDVKERSIQDIAKEAGCHKREIGSLDERKSLKDLQNKIDKYKQSNPYGRPDVNVKKDFIEQR